MPSNSFITSDLPFRMQLSPLIVPTQSVFVLSNKSPVITLFTNRPFSTLYFSVTSF